MRFCEKLNEYMINLDCTAKELCEFSGISPSTLSRYRSGERVPEVNSEAFSNLCVAISKIAEKSTAIKTDLKTVMQQFNTCEDFPTADKESLCSNFNTLVTGLDINLSQMCKYINYDVSTVFRFRNGTRKPAEPKKFAVYVASYVSTIVQDEGQKYQLSKIIGCDPNSLSAAEARKEKIREWLLSGNVTVPKSNITNFLNKLDEFDLNEYIKAIHFDEMKVPSLPFQLPTSKYYYGIKEMMESELDFLKATVLSRSKKPVTLYSDMPMEEMAKDPDFPKKWMFGMALMLKKGLHLNNIHNIDRSFDEMMLGLEGWIPMYMTGQISPYYLHGAQSNVFNHFIRVSGAAALSGEAINGHHSNGRYYLSKTKEDISYYQTRADDLLKNALPLMEIYRSERSGELDNFLYTDSMTEGNRKNILSSPPLYTLSEDLLKSILGRHGVNKAAKAEIINFYGLQKNIISNILKKNFITDEIALLSGEEFKKSPAVMQLSGMFFDGDIKYSYEEYSEHLRLTKEFAEKNENYSSKFSSFSAFSNLQIIMHEGKWAMISKGNSPAIHFVIKHPKLRSAIEKFVPPIVEE